MSDLFSSIVSPESVLSGRFRVHPVMGDEMEPTLRGGRDYVLTAPVTNFEGEGIYLIDVGFGIELYRVTNMLGPAGELVLSRENPLYGSHLVARKRFNEAVVGIVVADIRTRNDKFFAG